MQIKHIIWDWNGTLFNDMWLCVDVINNLLQKRNHPILSEIQYRNIFGFPVKDYYERAGFDFTHESFEEVGTEFIVEYNKRKDECVLFDEVLQILKTIKNNGITQSVLSAREETSLKQELDYYKVSQFLNYSFGLNNHYAGSKVKLGKHLISRLKLPTYNILMIGDTVHDYETAMMMEVNCILIDKGHQTTEVLKKCKVPILNSIGEVPDYLKNF